MGIEIRLFPVIDAFSRPFGMRLGCSADPSLPLAKQLLDSTADGSGCGRGPTGAGLTAGSWRCFRNPPLTPRITWFVAPANKDSLDRHIEHDVYAAKGATVRPIENDARKQS